MRQMVKNPLLTHSHLPLFLLAGTMIGYALATFILNRILSDRVMRGLISVSAYQNQLSRLVSAAGLAASVLLFGLAVWCVFQSRGISRAAFILTALASGGPLMVAQASRLLFQVLGLPTMGAGSVLAATFAALVFTLPMTIAFILLASSRSNPRPGRWIALVSALVTLAALVYPIYITVLALLITPGAPGLGPKMTASGYLLYLRFALPGLGLLLLALVSVRQKRTTRAETP